MLAILICDNDVVRGRSLCEYVQNAVGKEISTINVVNSKNDLGFFLDECKDILDVVFVRTNISSRFGVDAAKRILDFHPSAQIVFVTDREIHIQELYDIDFAYRLQDPYSIEGINAALERVAQRLNKKEKQYIVIKNKQGMKRVKLSSILFFEKDRRQIRLVSDTDTHLFYGGFNELLPTLDGNFVRCHNSYIVNLAKAEGLVKHAFVMSNGSRIPLSRTYYKEVKEVYDKYYNNVNI